MRQFLLLSALGMLLIPAAGQSAERKPLTHDDYDRWRSLGAQAVSDDGQWVAVVIRPQVGDGDLVVRHTREAKEYHHPRGTSPSFTEDGKWLMFTISPSRDDELEYQKSLLRTKSPRGRTGRQEEPEEPEGKPGEGETPEKAAEGGFGSEAKPERPLNGLGIMNLATGNVEVIERVKSFRVLEEGPSFVVAHLEKPKPARPTKPPEKKDSKEAEHPKETPPVKEEEHGAAGKEPQKRERTERRGRGSPGAAKKPETPKYLEDGTDLLVRNLSTGSTDTIPHVTSFGLVQKRATLWYARNSKKSDAKDSLGLFALDLAANRKTTLVEGAARYTSLTTDREARHLAFVSNRLQREAEKPTYDVYLWDFQTASAQRVVGTDTEGFPPGRTVAAGGRGSGGRGFRGRGRFGGGDDGGGGLRFSRDGQVLMLGTSELPEEDLPKLLDEEKVTLDIWHWQDPLLQTMQAKQSEGSVDVVYHTDGGRLTVLSTHDTESVSFLTDDGGYALVHDSRPYLASVSWDGMYSDVYVANTANGARRKVIEHLRGRAQASPDGRYLAYFENGHWHAIDLVSEKMRVVTAKLPVSFAIEDWDTPQPRSSYGVAGWTKDSSEIILHDRYDVWSVKLEDLSATCVTDGLGRAQQIRFRHVDLDPEERWVLKGEELLLSAVDQNTYASGYYRDSLEGMAKPRKVIMFEKGMGPLRKAKKASQLFFTLSSFAESPDLWTSGLDFSDVKRLTDSNPQQSEYRWGKAEIVTWYNADGVPLQGILIKPDGFDPKKKYPMMVHFYEKSASGLHRYVTPQPGTSPNAAYYVSNGYLWFSPDIIYRDGYPGESCLKCVVSGVQSLIATGFVDRGAIGASGHSWGGYQTAYLVAHSDIFKAVESGAPVSNMTSAYGGIRWGSGMSRAFQYEKTQSRIGGTLWEYPIRFVENSPIFHADKVNTPVLMLHNDQDGAVPWYQGIEYFSALRRLGKEVYLFNYVGADHGLRRRANQMDWTKRMQQYFDHHLRGHAKPDWMAHGVAYKDREKEKFRFSPPKHAVPIEKPAEPPVTKPAALEPVGVGEQGQR